MWAFRMHVVVAERSRRSTARSGQTASWSELSDCNATHFLVGQILRDSPSEAEPLNGRSARCIIDRGWVVAHLRSALASTVDRRFVRTEASAGICC